MKKKDSRTTKLTISHKLYRKISLKREIKNNDKKKIPASSKQNNDKRNVLLFLLESESEKSLHENLREI